MRHAMFVLIMVALVSCGTSGPTALPATPFPTVSTEWKTWTDVDGRVRLQYSPFWTIGRFSTADNIALFRSPYGVALSINEYPTRQPKDMLAAITAGRIRDNTYKYLNEETTQVTVGGTNGYLLSSEIIPRDNSTTEHSRNLVWMGYARVTTWTFSATGPGMWDRSEIDKMIASVEFL